MKRLGCASIRARHAACAASTLRGAAPKLPWLTVRKAGSRSQVSPAQDAGAMRPRQGGSTSRKPGCSWRAGAGGSSLGGPGDPRPRAKGRTSPDRTPPRADRGRHMLAGRASPRAQATGAWPQDRVTIVTSLPAGSSVDITTRVFAERLAVIWGRPVVVDNRGGANGVLACQHVARAKPDGLTLLATSRHDACRQPGAARPPALRPRRRLRRHHPLRQLALRGDGAQGPGHARRCRR